MAVAMIHPEGELANQWKKPKHARAKIAGLSGVGARYVQHARAVLQYAPDIAPNVLSGATALQEAYDEARRRKAAAENEEASMARLRQEAADLAELVTEGRMKLSEALAGKEGKSQTHKASKQWGRHYRYTAQGGRSRRRRGCSVSGGFSNLVPLELFPPI